MAISEDSELELQKLSHDDGGGKFPQAVHLARRCDYLFKILQSEHRQHSAKKRAATSSTNASSPSKSSKSSTQPLTSPNAGTKRQRSMTTSTTTTQAHEEFHLKKTRRRSNATPNKKYADCITSPETLSLLAPVSHLLTQLKDERSNDDPMAVLSVIKLCVVPVGNLICALSTEQQRRSEKIRVENSLWECVRDHWPFTNVTSEQIKQAYQKITKVTETSSDLTSVLSQDSCE